MNYDLFRTAWEEAVTESGLRIWSVATETIDLRTMARRYRAFFSLGRLPSADGFNITTDLNWEWDALLSARSETTEEDALMQFLGDDRRDVPTEPPWLRVDIVLHAVQPWGKSLPAPSARAWQRWVAEVERGLDPLLLRGTEDDDGRPKVLAWRGEPAARFTCQPDGRLALTHVEVAAWEGIGLPRQWDNPDRGYDDEPDEQLSDLCTRIARALQVWGALVKRLEDADL